MSSIFLTEQLNPAATTPEDLYTVSANSKLVVGHIMVVNQGTSAATFRISVRDSGAVADPKQYIAYDVPIVAKGQVKQAKGITLNEADVVTVYASSANLSFNLFGEEIS